MRTAEIIVQEYLDLGYSLESLRVLADSRQEPLRSELLAILDARAAAEVAEVACEAASAGGEENVFFVAEDDECVAGDDEGIDFNLMAAGSQAEALVSMEESVEEVLGEMTEESVADVVAEPDANVFVMPAAMSTAPAAEIEVAGEASADYLPEAAAPAVTSEDTAETVMETIPATVSEGAVAPTVPTPDAAESRRDRRRRERARRKKEKRARKETPVGEALPEIVLTRSEGTETLVPEQGEKTEQSETYVNPVVSVLTPDEVLEDSGIVGESAEQSAPTEETPLDESSPVDAGDFAMIVANGGDELRSEANDVVNETDEADAHTVILFRDFFPVQDGNEAEEEEAEDDFAPAMLRVLPTAEGTEETSNEAEPAGEADEEDVFPPLARLGLLRAFVGGPEVAFETADAGDDHVIVSMDLDEGPTDAAAERAAIEQEYQVRLDEFATRLLEVQKAVAESEARVAEKSAALQDKEAEVAAMLAAKTLDEERAAALAGERDALQKEIDERDARLEQYAGIRDEHERLFTEFEDLRRAYNEVVTDIMPGLQSERDELALTIERQTDAEDALRGSLKAARKRLAVGYSMGAAACLMLVSMPVANWLRSSDETREFAMDRQRVTELRERVETAERQNVAASQTVAELERKLNLAVMELAKVEERNGDVSRRTRDLAAAASVPSLPGGGVPTRASTMALQAAPGDGGRLRVNEVRDPAGSIEQVYADNRSRQRADNGPQLASSNDDAVVGRIPVSMVASRRDAAAKPERTGRPAAVAAAADTPKAEETVAKVRAGEGVAQVVYRVMGTRDPEVINWVIRENNIKKDRRGNPRIYPDQALRLPKNVDQAASATRRR